MTQACPDRCFVNASTPEDLRTDPRVRVPTFHPYNAPKPAGSRATRRHATPHWQWLYGRAEQVDNTYTIFEGTSEIQRLVIARSISGIHIR